MITGTNDKYTAQHNYRFTRHRLALEALTNAVFIISNPHIIKNNTSYKQKCSR
jgi:hypothetical protein